MRKLFFLILFISIDLFGNNVSSVDTIESNIKYDKLKIELRSLSSTLDSTVKIKEIERIENEIGKIKNAYIQKSISTDKPKKNSLTDWIRAIASAIGIPATIYGIYRLFKKDQKKERKLKSLEDIANSQEQINNNFIKQLEEIQKQTQEFSSQSNSMVKQNEITSESLTLEKEKYNDLNVKKYEELEEYYVEMIKFIQEPIESQIVSLKKFLSQLKERKNPNYIFSVIPSLKGENIEKINHTDLYKIFVSNRGGDKKDKLKAFHELDDSISIIKFFKEQLPKTYEKFNIDYEKCHLNWNENVDKIRRLYEKKLIENEINEIKPEEDVFMKKFGEIIWNWNQMGLNPNIENIRDAYFMYDNFLIPIEKLCNEVRPPEFLDFISLIVDCKVGIAEFDNLKQGYGDLIEKDIKTLLNIKEKLENAVKKLQTFDKI